MGQAVGLHDEGALTGMYVGVIATGGHTGLAEGQTGLAEGHTGLGDTGAHTGFM